uniref:Uncharacterized protein n=1 Tax=Siphoviridae sp. ctCQc22 TaxID=2827807 RepID=A0A8S5SWI9_9CAUD|nr:MAG TPA: hypothetical protein [Siphoviridae sp. ctCQc22]
MWIKSLIPRQIVHARKLESPCSLRLVFHPLKFAALFVPAYLMPRAINLHHFVQ